LAARRVADFVVDALACVRRFAAEAAERLFAAGCLVAVALLPDDTRDECLARARRTFLGAASAVAPSANAATSATSSIFIVLRIIESSSAGEDHPGAKVP
jgi:hypothetical protein